MTTVAEQLPADAVDQLRRDWRNRSTEISFCVKCMGAVLSAIDGRCLGCYSTRFHGIFGVPLPAAKDINAIAGI